MNIVVPVDSPPVSPRDDANVRLSEASALNRARDQGHKLKPSYAPVLRKLLIGHSVPPFLTTSSTIYSIGCAITPRLFNDCDTRGLDYRSVPFDIAIAMAGFGFVWSAVSYCLRPSRTVEPEYLITTTEDVYNLLSDEEDGLCANNKPPCGQRLHELGKKFNAICKRYPNATGAALGVIFAAPFFVASISLFMDGLCNLGAASFGSIAMISMALVASISLLVLCGSVFLQCRKPLQSDMNNELSGGKRYTIPDRRFTLSSDDENKGQGFINVRNRSSSYDTKFHALDFSKDNRGKTDLPRILVVDDYAQTGHSPRNDLQDENQLDSPSSAEYQRKSPRAQVRRETLPVIKGRERKESFDSMMVRKMAEPSVESTSSSNFEQNTDSDSDTIIFSSSSSSDDGSQ